MVGTVEFFNNVKGWGIIKSDNDGESFFVHHSRISDKRFFPSNKREKFRTLKSGQKVNFVPNTSEKNLRAAENVEILDNENI